MRRVACALAAAAAAGLTQAGTVEVTFVHPERYTDAGKGADLQRVESTLSEHLRKLADASLPARQSLKVEVLDVDLAGEVQPWRRRLEDARVLRGRADWPTLTLRYTLRDGDQVVRQGEERLVDMGYLTARSNQTYSADALPYEKRMLSQWFAQRFGAAKY